MKQKRSDHKLEKREKERKIFLKLDVKDSLI